MQSPDNICMTPCGDLCFGEDGFLNDRIMGITPEGKIYPFANNCLSDSELEDINDVSNMLLTSFFF